MNHRWTRLDAPKWDSSARDGLGPCPQPAGCRPVRKGFSATQVHATIYASTTAAKAWRRSQTLYSIATVARFDRSASRLDLSEHADRACAMRQKPTCALLAGLAVALLAVSALAGHAYGKGHGHSGKGHGAHHSAHHAGRSGLWRQSSGSASPDAGNAPAGRPGGVGQSGHPTSLVPTTVLPRPTGP
jgi:hypothetical protein